MFDFIAALEASTGLLSFATVRAMLGVSERTLRKMVAERTIPSLLVGGLRRFDPATLHRWAVKRCPEMARGRTQASA